MKDIACKAFALVPFLFVGGCSGMHSPVAPASSRAFVSPSSIALASHCRIRGGGEASFWAANITSVTTSDLDSLIALNLKNADGSTFDPFAAIMLGDFFTSGDPLSVQLAVMVLNVRHGYLDGSSTLGMAGGLSTVNEWISLANAALGTNGDESNLLNATNQCH